MTHGISIMPTPTRSIMSPLSNAVVHGVCMMKWQRPCFISGRLDWTRNETTMPAQKVIVKPQLRVMSTPTRGTTTQSHPMAPTVIQKIPTNCCVPSHSPTMNSACSRGKVASLIFFPNHLSVSIGHPYCQIPIAMTAVELSKSNGGFVSNQIIAMTLNISLVQKRLKSAICFLIFILLLKLIIFL